MAFLNKIMLIGNLGADPEMRYMPNGNPVTNFNIAVNRSYTDSSGERHDETEWFTVAVYGNRAETVNQYLKKGSKVYVEGRLESREYVGSDGQQRKAYNVIANDFKFMDRKPLEENQNEESPSKENIENSDKDTQNKIKEEEIEDLPW